MAEPLPLGLADLLDRRRLHALAGSRTYDRAFDYARDGRVGPITVRSDAISAAVRGTRPYTAGLELVDDELAWRCDCPVGVDGELCKHAVALGLAWLEDREAEIAGVPQPGRTDPAAAAGPPAAGPPAARSPAITWDETAAWLRTLDPAALLEILSSEATADDGLRQRLLRRAEVGRLDTGAVAALRRTLGRAFRVRDFVPYRETGRYAEGIHEAIDRIDGLLAAGAAAAVIDLAEDALGRLEDVLGMVDDSNGELGGIRDRLEDLHLAACRAAPPEPVGLAARLFAWETESEWEMFHGAAGRYADILGAEGLAEYRRLADAVWATVPRLGPGERSVDRELDRPGRGPSRFRITAIMKTLADTAGDTDGLIAIMAHDLSYAYHYLEIALVCMAAGREDDAIDWAERGVRAFPERTDGRLRLFLADRYHARGRHDAAMALVWADFTERPDREHYRQLQASAARADAWPEWHDRALAHARTSLEGGPRGDPAGGAQAGGGVGGDGGRDSLEAWQDRPSRHDASTLVDLLMVDGDVDAAWVAASAHGCRRTLWLELARAREADHPLDAALICQREVEHQIASKRNDGYREAVALIRRVQRLLESAGRAADIPPYLADVRARHRQKRNFITALDGGRIGR